MATQRTQRGASAARHAVVTGAGRGIGRAIALRLAGEGARLSLMGRRRAPLKRVADACLDAGAADVCVRTADVTDGAAVERAFRGAAKANGPIHVLVANAGVGGPNGPGPDDRFEEIVATNLNGTYRCLRAAEARLADGPEPRHLVVLSSVLARFGVPGYSGYCASKTALLGLVRSLALELADRGVQVNAVCPGWVDTEMAWEGLDGMAEALGVSRDEAYALAMERVPLGRMSTPEDVAGVVAWLTSPDARGVTGQGLDVNNGAWMG